MCTKQTVTGQTKKQNFNISKPEPDRTIAKNNFKMTKVLSDPNCCLQ